MSTVRLPIVFLDRPTREGVRFMRVDVPEPSLPIVAGRPGCFSWAGLVQDIRVEDNRAITGRFPRPSTTEFPQAVMLNGDVREQGSEIVVVQALLLGVKIGNYNPWPDCAAHEWMSGRCVRCYAKGDES